MLLLAPSFQKAHPFISAGQVVLDAIIEEDFFRSSSAW